MADAVERAFVGSETGSLHEGLTRTERILALEIRPQKFGFVVLEESRKLLDWGVRNYGSRGAHRGVVLKKRICALFDLYIPSVVVTRQRDSSSRRVKRAIWWTVQTIMREAEKRSIELQTVDAQEIQRFFSEHSCQTKHQRASLLSKWFEELAWKLPPKRKPWQSEKYNTAIFDAAAVGVVFLADRSSDHSANF